MKKVEKVMVTLVAIGSFLYGGGDIVPPTFETEEVYVPVEPAPEPPKPAIVKKAPVVPLKPVNNISPLGLYVALGLVAAEYEPTCKCKGTGDSDKTAGLMGRVGYDFNQYVGVEARGMRTNWRSSGGKFKHYGAFLKPMYPVSRDVNVYGLAGLAKTKTDGRGRQLTDVSGFAWGAGLEYDLSSDKPKEGKYSRDFDGYGDQEEGWGLFVDYERLFQKSGSPDLDTISAGITYDF